MKMLILLFMFAILQDKTFKEKQLVHSRVADAYAYKENVVSQYFSEKHIAQAGFNLYLRAFKKERKVEVWVREKGKDQYAFLTSYDFCSSSGVLGPKRKEGDLQIPEGVYHISHFNPQSNFFLSLGINYPNDSDRIFSDRKHPGQAIYIHGNCVTIGCIPITDDKIKELYVLAVEARNNGQQKIPVHIFPFAKIDMASIESLSGHYDSADLNFWRNLEPIYRDFEKTKKLAKITVNKDGSYRLN
jgi:murein L,D-transpeptidase YafK